MYARQASAFRPGSRVTPAASLLMCQRSMSLRSAASPAASTLAHCAAVSRMERCSSISAAGFGGLPSGFLKVFISPLSVVLKCFTTTIFRGTVKPVKTLKTLQLRIKDKHSKVLVAMAREVNQVFVESGARFGMLTALREVDGPGKRRWDCVCDCGQAVTAEATKLRTGHKKSCGCLRSKGDHLGRMTTAAASANRVPIIGERFSRLIVLSEDSERNLTCLCDCGATAVKSRAAVVSGDTKSCGCLQSERGTALADARAKKQRRSAGLPENELVSPVNKALRNNFRALSAEIKRRDNFTCLLCGERGGRLNVHHIESWAAEPSLRFSPFNLATLCRICHIEKAHSGNVHRSPNPQVAEALRLTVQWTCGCGAVHDRDVNAARNIAARGHARLAGGIPVL